MLLRFQIWAPAADRVDLLVDGFEHQMLPDQNGFWRLEVDCRCESPKYALRINGKGPFPDPASLFLPEGVHGRSQAWREPFAWTDDGWHAPGLENAVIYELHTGTFTDEGTFEAAILRLDHLVSLGITHVELMPVAAFPGRHGWGYDGVGLYAPHRFYGTPTQLKQLVNACHTKGLAIILDVVYNHLGPDGNYLGQFGPYFADRYHTPWGQAVNFDGPWSDEVREFVINNALMWLRDYHFDGLRLDAVHQVYDFSATHILEELQCRVDHLSAQNGKTYILIAESDQNDPKLLKPVSGGGFGLAAQWLDDFHHSLHVLLTGEQRGYYRAFNGAEDLKKCIKNGFVYDGQFSVTRHRRHGRFAGRVDPWRYLVCSQNHDQIGNRAFGERLCHLISFESCRIAAALLLLSPFTPVLFQGEEWGASSPFLYFTDHTDENLAKAVREGRRREFPEHQDSGSEVPDPQDSKTFLASRLKWNETSMPPHAAMIAWYKDLINLRKKHIAQIRSCDREFLIIDADRRLFVLACGNLRLFINSGSGQGEFHFGGRVAKKMLLCNLPPEICDDRICLPPEGVALFSRD